MPTCFSTADAPRNGASASCSIEVKRENAKLYPHYLIVTYSLTRRLQLSNHHRRKEAGWRNRGAGKQSIFYCNADGTGPGPWGGVHVRGKCDRKRSFEASPGQGFFCRQGNHRISLYPEGRSTVRKDFSCCRRRNPRLFNTSHNPLLERGQQRPAEISIVPAELHHAS